MKIEINDKPSELPEDTTLQQLLEEKQLADSSIAVAINQQIICQSRYADTILREGDKILLIGAAKGG